MDAPPTADRDPALLLAGLHLRLGSLALARAELETLAGADALDALGRVDLAEVRWRTGDLIGAGEVARAVLAESEEPLVALVVAAEAAANLGRPSEARRLASRALELASGGIDPIFAGMTRSAVWPADPAEPVPSPATLFPTERVVIDAPIAPDGTAEVAVDDGDRRAVDGPGFWDATEAEVNEPGADVPAPAAAAELETEPEPVVPDPATTHVSEDIAARLETGRAAIDAGDPASAALHLGLVVRLAPGLAPAVIETIGDHPDPALLMVRGDALRAAGRDSEAQDAYARALAGH